MHLLDAPDIQSFSKLNPVYLISIQWPSTKPVMGAKNASEKNFHWQPDLNNFQRKHTIRL